MWQGGVWQGGVWQGGVWQGLCVSSHSLTTAHTRAHPRTPAHTRAHPRAPLETLRLVGCDPAHNLTLVRVCAAAGARLSVARGVGASWAHLRRPHSSVAQIDQLVALLGREQPAYEVDERSRRELVVLEVDKRSRRKAGVLYVLQRSARTMLTQPDAC